MQEVQALETELAKGKSANDERVATIINGLVELVPGAAAAIVSAFRTPLLAGIAGPVTKWSVKMLGAG
jgi:hypothetical protein